MTSQDFFKEKIKKSLIENKMPGNIDKLIEECGITPEAKTLKDDEFIIYENKKSPFITPTKLYYSDRKEEEDNIPLFKAILLSAFIYSLKNPNEKNLQTLIFKKTENTHTQKNIEQKIIEKALTILMPEHALQMALNYGNGEIQTLADVFKVKPQALIQRIQKLKLNITKKPYEFSQE